jgi:hypothetical protein
VIEGADVGRKGVVVIAKEVVVVVMVEEDVVAVSKSCGVK